MNAFDTLLVANRGEIARRVIRSARARGLRTVAVYSDADRQAAHVREADTAVHLGPTPATESYLSVEAVLRAARESGAQAIHPGYGFLSERAAFARRVEEAGLVFVGPSAEVMDSMGRKDRAREIAVAAGVPVVPDHPVDATDLPEDEFPILVKAAAGGGGKGMRVVRRPADLPEAIEAARREAQSSFGDDTLLIERYVENGRHVEVQVLADAHGHVVHLFERDCSSQRRHQKVIEEAPSPSVTEAVRAVLTESAVALAAEVGYVNAGTVEFLVDPARGTDGVYFLEMNTRLQVEHPVTELVVRVGDDDRPLDLVDLQLRVASGEPLPFTQDEVRCAGHAMEARVYAEDAFNGFLPQAGTATFVHWSGLARNDEALASGQEVGTSYDPMLGKVIVHAPTREAARKKLVAALDDTAVIGLTTNTGFLRELAASRQFRDAEIDTGWLDRHPDGIALPDDDIAAVFAAWVVAQDVPRDASPFGVSDGWRSAGPAAPVTVELDDRWLVSRDHVSGPSGTHAVALVERSGPVVRLEVDGVVVEAVVVVEAHQVEVAHRGHTRRFTRPDAFGPGAAAGTSDGTLLAPMPGTVLAVDVAEGDAVEEGQRLGVVEAMKMELALRAPHAGTVATVGAGVGEQVALGAVLFHVEREGAEK